MSAPSHRVTVTPVLDTSAYAAGDCMSDVFTITTGARGSARVTLRNCTVIDEDDQGVAFDILFFSSSPTIASAKNAAFSITDANLASLVGVVAVASGDYVDLGAQRAACKSLDLDMKCETAGTLYGVLVSRGTATYAANGIDIQLTFAHEGI